MNAAVVFVAYRLPEERIRAHLEWNAGIFGAPPELKIYIVTDRTLSFPAGVNCLVYPRAMPVFSLARTKNYGIRQALDAGAEIIVATDADMAWTGDAWAECRAVGERQCVAPIYHMVDSFSLRHAFTPNRVVADLAIGTVAMRASGWRKVCGYNERLEGYGADDGDLWRRIGAAGIRQYRGAAIYHIAHQSGAVQQEAHTAGDKSRGTRADHWGRGDGFNPDQLQNNIRRARQPWQNPDWGK